MWMVFVLVLLAVVCGPVDGSVSPGNSPTTSYAMLGIEFGYEFVSGKTLVTGIIKQRQLVAGSAIQNSAKQVFVTLENNMTLYGWRGSAVLSGSYYHAIFSATDPVTNDHETVVVHSYKLSAGQAPIWFASCNTTWPQSTWAFSDQMTEEVFLLDAPGGSTVTYATFDSLRCTSGEREITKTGLTHINFEAVHFPGHTFVVAEDSPQTAYRLPTNVSRVNYKTNEPPLVCMLSSEFRGFRIGDLGIFWGADGDFWPRPTQTVIFELDMDTCLTRRTEFVAPVFTLVLPLPVPPLETKRKAGNSDEPASYVLLMNPDRQNRQIQLRVADLVTGAITLESSFDTRFDESASESYHVVMLD